PATKSGKAPAHSVIHGIGTPARSERSPRSKSSFEGGWSAMKRSPSLRRSSPSRSRSIVLDTRGAGYAARSGKAGPRETGPGKRANLAVEARRLPADESVVIRAGEDAGRSA